MREGRHQRQEGLMSNAVLAWLIGGVVAVTVIVVVPALP
jgi:tetrahydromethanopterin S-methyltransferase subunit F